MLSAYLEARIVEIDTRMNELHREMERLQAIREQLSRWRAPLVDVG